VLSKCGLCCRAGSDPASDSGGSLKDVNSLSQRADLFLMGKARKTLASSFHTDDRVNEFYIGLKQYFNGRRLPAEGVMGFPFALLRRKGSP